MEKAQWVMLRIMLSLGICELKESILSNLIAGGRGFVVNGNDNREYRPIDVVTIASPLGILCIHTSSANHLAFATSFISFYATAIIGTSAIRPKGCKTK